ncbi:MAG TPA: hypothetical protein VGJ15_06675, partial [Pirellulales bacterium]
MAVAVAALVQTDNRSRGLALNTVKLVGATLAISLPLGSVLGVLIARTNLPLRGLAAGILGLLVIVPLYLIAAAWLSGFGQFGWFTILFGKPLTDPWLWKWRGAIFIHAV